MSPQITFSNPSSLPPPIGYSHVVSATGGTAIFISGQVARDASGALIAPGDFKGQLEQIFENLKLALVSAGASFDQVVKLNYYCSAKVEPAELRSVVQVRDRYVNTDAPPASTFVFVSRLVREEWLVEVDAVACIT